MPITVTIADTEPAAAFERARAVVTEYVERDPNFNGCDARVQRGDFTELDHGDSDIPGADIGRLWSDIQHALRGEA